MKRSHKKPHPAKIPRFPGKIVIGGTIPTKLIQSLAAAIIRDITHGRLRVGRRDVEGRIRKTARSKATFELTDRRAVYGRFYNTESFCFEHRIPFRRRSEVYRCYDAEILLNMPKKRRRGRLVQCSQDGEPVVGLRELEMALRQKRTLAHVVRRLRSATEEVPPLKIV